MDSARSILEQFDEKSLPDLDTVVLGALELFAETKIPELPKEFKNPIVVGSAGAFATGKMIFSDGDAVFADESTFEEALKKTPDVDGVYIVSSSGSKHAVVVAEALSKSGVPTLLLTTNPDAPAKEFVEPDSILLFPKNREPYTYNTSTYLGMVLASTGEDPQKVKEHIESVVASEIRDDLRQYNAFTFILPKQCGTVRELIRVKFDEMFAPIVTGRAFTEEEIKHAKTVISSEKECFVSICVENEHFGAPEHRMHVSLPADADYAAVMAVSYYVVGAIQKQHPPYFKEHVADYVQQASEIFGKNISVIVS